MDARRPPRLAVARRTVVTTLVATLVALAGGPAGAGPARAATSYGHDVSWPQCPVEDGGYGLPMPPATTAFVVVGLTRGLPFTANPCLASQVDWVRSRAKPAHAYTMAAYPTSAQLAAHGRSGPWAATSLAGRLANVGYAQARYAVDTLRAVGWAPPVVWVDVEPRPRQPWPAGNTTREVRNRFVLAGVLRGLDDAGYAYGLYSYANGWREIAGTWRLPGLPVWATAGRRGAAAAQAMCPGPSFSGGPVHLAQWYDDTRDYDLTCPAYRQAPPVPYPPSGANDLDGNWTTDVVARDRATGDLWLYPRDAAGRWLPRVRIGTGWQRAAVLDTSGDLTNDGVPDVLAVDRVSGDLWLYPRRADATFAPRVRAGTGWQVMDAVLGTGDLTGDGVPDVVARERANGRLWLYPRTVAGGFAARRQLGTGWQGMNAVLGAGDLSGDGVPDLLARERSSGALWLYPGNGRSGLGARARLGGGWNAFDLVATPGDVDRDGKPDVLARDRATASLWLYTRDDAGAWRARVRLGTGWRAFDAIQ